MQPKFQAPHTMESFDRLLSDVHASGALSDLWAPEEIATRLSNLRFFVKSSYMDPSFPATEQDKETWAAILKLIEDSHESQL